MSSILTVGLVLNTQKKKAFSIARKTIDWLVSRDINYLVQEAAADELGELDKKADYAVMRQKVDIVILFGGDGTFLHTAHHFIGTDVPLMGINLGKLGFLTETEIDELDKTLLAILNGEYDVEKRMLLEAEIVREGDVSGHCYALNDVVINRAGNVCLINVEFYINEEIVNSYRADGLIIATPTGSTAYSLSAGGPIINPQIRAILITPICPHNLYERPMVISDQERIKVIVSGKNKRSKMTCDGRYSFNLEKDDQILITASNKEISLVKFPERSFYNILHEKMRVGLA